MLKGLTSTFKNGCNNVEVMYREYLVLENQTIPIKAELSDDSYENGNFIGTFIFKTIKFETDAQYDFKNKEFEYYKEVNGESIKIGTFITTEVEINDTTEIVKVVGMDYGLKTQIAYRSQLDYSTGNITLLDVWNEACQLSGLESGIDYFPNGDFIVDNDQFTGTGATIRDVFKGIAMSSGSFVKVMNDDKIYLVFNSYTGDTETATINGSGSVNDGYAIDNLQIEGKSQQEGTPTPANPVEVKTVSGIGNLFDKNEQITLDKAYTSDGVITTTTGSFVQESYISVKPNTAYTISAKVISSVFRICEYTSDKTFIERKATNNVSSYTFTTTSTTNYVRISGITANIDTMKLEIGSINHQYVPYGHWLPVKVSNKNLFDKDNANILNAYINNKTIIDLSTTRTLYIPCEPDTTYTISKIKSTRFTVISTVDTPANNVVGTNEVSNTSATSLTITTGSSDKYLAVFYYYSNSDTLTEQEILNSIQIEEGSTATDYIEHQEQTTLIDLNKNNLFGDTWEQGSIATATGQNVENTNYKRTIGYTDVKSNAIYTFDINQVESQIVIFYYNDTTFLSFSNLENTNSITFKTPNNCTKIRARVLTTNSISNTQLFEGTTPYYELCSIGNIKDLLTIKDGSAVITQNISKVAFNGTNIVTVGNYKGIYGSNMPPNKINRANVGLIYERAKFITLATQRVENTIYENTGNVVILGSGNDTLETLKQKFNGGLLYYVLKTSQTITLRGTYDINLYEGVNHISIEDELEPTMVMSYYKDNLDIIEDYVELEDKRDTRPWTCLRLGMSQVEGENVDYVDEDLVAKYGENWLILNDNPFAYTQQKRQQLITNIFNRIKEFGYSAFVSKTSFKPYLTAGDIVKFKNREGNLVKTILLRYNHNAEEITLESPSETSATVNYVYPLTDIDLYKRTEIQVDKANNQIRTNVDNIGLLQTSSSSNADNINTLTSLVDSQGREIKRLGTKIVQDVGSINASVTAIQDEIKQGVGLVKTTSVTIDNNGLSVSTDTSKIQTTMTNDTFKITDKGGTELAKFGYDENEGISIAEMDNLTVKNYFMAGVHRVETIEIDGEERTGWFYMGG